MKRSTIADKRKAGKGFTNRRAKAGKADAGFRVWAVAFWLIVWQLTSMALGQEILLVSPVSVLLRLGELVRTLPFWHAVFFSFVRNVGGFLLAILAGVLFAALSFCFSWFRELLHPVMAVVKATPVASFIILCLVWIPSRGLSVFISFLMVLPIIYTNVLEGIHHTDRQLLEMAKVFRIRGIRRMRYIYFSQVMPHFRSACGVSLGLCWKSGIAAEVIGMPDGSIGDMLYQAKIYLDTPDLFAWTFVIILVSVLFGKVFMKLLDLTIRAVETR
ncbi:ABC transporter permease [Diplocloster hominis]|uniref:ABC transporter permease n=1 Tax=Diplocloster hominis TaxID=3079010 RepID=UPI0031BBB543